MGEAVLVRGEQCVLRFEGQKGGVKVGEHRGANGGNTVQGGLYKEEGIQNEKGCRSGIFQAEVAASCDCRFCARGLVLACGGEV